jgi:hypothetical protein
MLVYHILQDGNTDGAVTVTGAANIAALDGTANTATRVPGPNADGSWPVGSPAAARQHIFLARTTSTSAPSLSGGNSTSEDLYFRYYVFSDVSTGTTLATVIENGSAGVATNGAGTSTTVSDTAVTTLGADRLALNLIGINDDGSGIALFTGASGGTWGVFRSYEEASGTDGTVAKVQATMATAGTIDGGSDAITSLAWGVVGFALIGTTADTPVPRHPGANFGSTAVLMGGIRRAWHRRRSGILVPDLWLPEGARA